MVKGTTSMGKFTRKHVHIRCRRCGKNSFHVRHHTCASCGCPDAKEENTLGSNGIRKCKKLNIVLEMKLIH